jgi:two-component system sensor histidine kinase UhpB
MTLRARLNLVVAGLSAAFVAVLLIAEVQSARASISEEITAANRVAAQLLGHVAALHAFDERPDALVAFLDKLGRVRAHDITLLGADGAVLYRSPASTWKVGREAPAWFARLLAPREARQRFELAGGAVLLLETDASRAVLDGWDAFVWLGTIAAAMLAAVNGAAFWLVRRTLEPIPVIVDGLARISGGDLGFRLPALPGTEARAIGAAFNAMAQAVEDKVGAERKAREAELRLEERRELGRLIEQRIEEERRLIAHELHDEFSQSVTAIRSLALAIAARSETAPDSAAQVPSQTKETAQVPSQTKETAQVPSQTKETARLIADEAARLYDAMHGLIPRLEPLTLDTLGLGETLENLVRDWQRRCPAIALALHCDIRSDLGTSVTLTIFRVVQEGLINALRHARPTRVEIDVRADDERAVVTVADDGVGLPDDWARPGRFGLRGLAERIEGLNGRFEVRGREPHGVRLGAEIPLGPATAMAAAAADAPQAEAKAPQAAAHTETEHA